ncbi:RNA polymerase sigma factor [Gryllotalpicola koreensis]|uniref:RNA polymerase sigma-70 region 2 domain-containing protein n=1 Tax=Gryllotalpicola koreensis TaxID=993086 RepID=A0ABP8AB92_9MICO
MSTDGEIISASLTTPERFGELYDRHARTVHRYTARRTSGQITADVMAETFLVAFEKRGSFDSAQTDARPWLLGIATLLLRKHARLEARAWKGLVAADAASILVTDPVADHGERLDAAAAIRRLAGAVRRRRLRFDGMHRRRPDGGTAMPQQVSPAAVALPDTVAVDLTPYVEALLQASAR